ncbi:MAG: acyl carrier protein [Halobacteriovoraceae bacterium]|nr:acyl carrier protein [Halobacteriovoraceae bacterium]|tara:strand:- start:1216 stop:2229 length:1014 start_codon:yes stop_codon:yes gene_type:complete
MNKKTALVICPGRGVYNSPELGYLAKYHKDQKDFIQKIDQMRGMGGEVTVSELDSMEKFKPSIHTKGENAASLIYTCSYCDYQAMSDQYEIVAVTGNSMGWYTALACGEVLDYAGSFHLINTMGGMLKDGLIGGQMIYPIVNENWVRDREKENFVKNKVNEMGAFISIEFGGYLVIGGEDTVLKKLMSELPEIDRFPMKLSGNGAFHTPLFGEISAKAKELISRDSFQKPTLPLIDGQGKIWQPLSTDINALYHYTLETQVCETYDFTKAVEVGLKEFAPDHIIILGPGTTMGGAVAQILIENKWRGLSSKTDFVTTQNDEPFVLSMGLEQQRKRVI